MLNILRRRAPWMRVLVHPVRVQGQGASLEIVRAVEEFNAWAQEPGEPSFKKVDLVVVVARGGGSIEDLWEFNEEIVARAIAASALPVVSAVGHEIDFTIADFAADLRAPTPSAAAELIAPDTAALRERLAGAAESFERELCDRVGARPRAAGDAGWRRAGKRTPTTFARRPPTARPRAGSARARGWGRLTGGSAPGWTKKGGFLRVAGLRQSLELRSRLIHSWREKLEVVLCCQQEKLRGQLHAAEGLLRVLGPQATLERGYSITTDGRGQVIRQTTGWPPASESSHG